jgi:hypothetical protein
METITAAVGIRNGVTTMPNNQADIRTVTGLLDRIPLAKGGTAPTGGLWSDNRAVLISQITVAIVTFQTTNRRPVIDGVVDRDGGTLRLMNQLAGPGPVTASVVSSDTGNSQLWVVAEPSSLDGTGPLQPRSISPPLTRKLVSVSGTSIKWFGVVVPLDNSGGIIGGAPHLFFTPSPWQGGYQDPGYDRFALWHGLWDKYTSAIGSQLVVSGVPQILVIPFYRNSQSGNLGAFLTNWREAISAVLTVAVDSIDPLFLRDKFEFDKIFSSSFSNGIVTHKNFNTSGAGAGSMTRIAFDLDGQAAGSRWRPSKGVVYLNTPAPSGLNPVGTSWYVGGRFAQIRQRYPGTIDHNLCPFLLLHGLSNFGR